MLPAVAAMGAASRPIGVLRVMAVSTYVWCGGGMKCPLPEAAATPTSYLLGAVAIVPTPAGLESKAPGPALKPPQSSKAVTSLRVPAVLGAVASVPTPAGVQQSSV